METFLHEIRNLAIPKDRKRHNLTFENIFNIIAFHSNSSIVKFLNEDLDLFKSKTKYLVYKTFAGGIIFLREPEVIEKIELRFLSDSNTTDVIVEYGSESRNERNVKYKPYAGKLEQLQWSMPHIFNHFMEYDKNTKLALLYMISNIAKSVCENLNETSWFMNYTKEFDLTLYIDQVSIHQMKIKTTYNKG